MMKAWELSETASKEVDEIKMGLLAVGNMPLQPLDREIQKALLETKIQVITQGDQIEWLMEAAAHPPRVWRLGKVHQESREAEDESCGDKVEVHDEKPVIASSAADRMDTVLQGMLTLCSQVGEAQTLPEGAMRWNLVREAVLTLREAIPSILRGGTTQHPLRDVARHLIQAYDITRQQVQATGGVLGVEPSAKQWNTLLDAIRIAQSALPWPAMNVQERKADKPEDKVGGAPWAPSTILARLNLFKDGVLICGPRGVLEEYQARVVEELLELGAKITRLSTFFQGPIFKQQVAPGQQELLRRQYEAMTTYADILQTRIVHF